MMPISACAAETPGLVGDPEKCVLQWEIRLAPHRDMHGADEGWPEQLILDANLGGDFKMAQRYMERYGWFAAATEDPNDLTLYFMPDVSPPDNRGDPRFIQRTSAIPAEGLKRACYAAWISSVPFTRVTRRGEQGQDVLYSVTTEDMPVNEF